MTYDYDDTPDLQMGERMAEAMRGINDTGAHDVPRYASLRPETQRKIDRLVQTETQILTTLRILGAVAALFAVSALGGVVWAGSSIVTLQARVDAAERRIDTHVHSDGHPPAIATAAEGRAEMRELRAETTARLTSIERQLSEIRDAVVEDGRRRRH